MEQHDGRRDPQHGEQRNSQGGDVLGVAERAFDLSGGALCLDFANSLDDRPRRRPSEFVETYADFLAFARQSQSLSDSRIARLAAEARRRPLDAEAARAGALAVREAIFRVFLALATGQSVSPADLTVLNAALGEALAHARVLATPIANGTNRPGVAASPAPVIPTDTPSLPASEHFAWGWADDDLPGLDMPLWPIVRSAADLLTSPALLPALRVCASDTCAWLFLDTSRNGSRRWCSMKTCGNRAKARRHHARVRAVTASTTR